MENQDNASQIKEGNVARSIEQKTARIPSDFFLWGAVGVMGLSLVGQLLQPRRMTLLNLPSRSGQLSLFVGQWAHTLLLLGIYNKIVKVAGASDRQEIEAPRRQQERSPMGDDVPIQEQAPDEGEPSVPTH